MGLKVNFLNFGRKLKKRTLNFRRREYHITKPIVSPYAIAKEKYDIKHAPNLDLSTFFFARRREVQV